MFINLNQVLMSKLMLNMEVEDAQLGDKVVGVRERGVENVDRGNVERRKSRRRRWSLTKQSQNQRRPQRSPLPCPLTMWTSQKLTVPLAAPTPQRLSTRTSRLGPSSRMATNLGEPLLLLPQLQYSPLPLS